MTDEMKVKCNDILRHYGEVHQQEKVIEEMAELISAIKHHDRKNYIEELADVGVMLEQLYQALSFEEQAEFIKMQHYKLDRQLRRINDEDPWEPDDLDEQKFREEYIKKQKDKIIHKGE